MRYLAILPIMLIRQKPERQLYFCRTSICFQYGIYKICNYRYILYFCFFCNTFQIHFSFLHSVQVEIKNFPERLELTFIDKGIPYNPLENKDPDVTLDIEKRKIGGLGIFLVKEMMDEVSYEYADGKNILKLKKNL